MTENYLDNPNLSWAAKGLLTSLLNGSNGNLTAARERTLPQEQDRLEEWMSELQAAGYVDLFGDLATEGVTDESRARHLFKLWKEQTNHPRSVMDEKRKALALRALKVYSIEQLKRALTGMMASPFHQGKTDRNSTKKYDQFELLLRDAEHIERFISLADRYAPRQKAEPRRVEPEPVEIIPEEERMTDEEYYAEFGRHLPPPSEEHLP